MFSGTTVKEFEYKIKYNIYIYLLVQFHYSYFHATVSKHKRKVLLMNINIMKRTILIFNTTLINDKEFNNVECRGSLFLF